MDLLISRENICLDDYFEVVFTIEFEKGENVSEIAKKIATDLNVGSWKTIKTLTSLSEKHLVLVIDELPRRKDVTCCQIRIAIPVLNIDPEIGGIPHLLSMLGMVFTLSFIKKIRLEEIAIPQSFAQKFTGPKFNFNDLLSLFQLKTIRPLIGFMIKPRVGYSTDEIIKIAKEILIGGADFICDDDITVSPSCTPIYDRVKALKQLVNEVEQKTGCRKHIMVNITSSPTNIIDIAKKCVELGTGFFYVNPFVCGFSIIELLRKEFPNIPIVGSRTFHGVMTRDPSQGIDLSVFLKLARLCGIDAMQIGSISGQSIHKHYEDENSLKKNIRCLREKFFNFKSSTPVICGGIDISNISENIRIAGKEIIFQIGTGMLLHPDGPKSGAKAILDLIEGLSYGKTYEEILKSSKELKKYWESRKNET